MEHVPATLFLANGDTVSGRITLNNEVLFPKDIMVKKAADMEKVHLLDVKGYTAEGTHYELKHTRNGFRPGNGFYFMKRLTPEGSRIHVYENKEKVIRNKAYNKPVYKPVYYVQFPNERRHRVHELEHRKLVPHFDKKMKAIVADCPELAQKIADKEKGYFYSRMNLSNEDRMQVLLNIAEAYNNCK